MNREVLGLIGLILMGIGICFIVYIVIATVIDTMGEGYMFGSGLVDTVDPDVVCDKHKDVYDGITC